MQRLRKKSGITLIEMLAVIVIIGILAGLILPAIQNARRRGRVVKANAEMRQLKTAWRSYVSTYMNDERVGSLPSGGAMTPNLVKILSGTADAVNPDKIRFMEFPADAEDVGFLDPWGKEYEVTIDPVADTEKTWNYATRVHPANYDPLR